MLESTLYGLINGISIGILAVAVGLHYKVGRYLDFFLPSFAVLGGYVAYLVIQPMGLPFILALVASGVTGAISALIAEQFVLAPLYRSYASKTVMLLTSLGGFLIVVNSVGVVFGSATLVVHPGFEKLVKVFGVQVPTIQFIILGCGVLFLIMLATWLYVSRTGRLLKAAFDSPSLLSTCGHDSNDLRRRVYTIAGLMAGLSGGLAACDLGVEPTGGLVVFLIAATAVVVGGVGRLDSALIASLSIGLFRAWSIWLIPNKWTESFIFALLFVALCLRPMGILPVRHTESMT